MRKIIVLFKQILFSLVGEKIYDYLRVFFRVQKVKIGCSDFNDPMIKFQKKLISECNIVFDIGSDRGYFSYRYSQMVGRKGKVYSFEPIKRTFDLQKRYLRYLKVKNVKMFNTAISNIQGLVKIIAPKIGNLVATSCAFIKTNDHDENNKNYIYYNVKAQRLDHIFFQEKLNHIDFIKIDVEGSELFVLQGAKVILKSEPIIFMEMINRHFRKYDYSAIDIFNFMNKLSFEPFIYTHFLNKLEYMPIFKKNALDYYFIPKSKIKDLIKKDLIIPY